MDGTGHPSAEHERRTHWDDRYRSVGPSAVSWYEDRPSLSLELLDLVGADPSDGVIDIGGGASRLTASLQARGYTDLTVLDVSSEALRVARESVGRPDEVTWIRADLLDWAPGRTWSVWHDRAVFHFLTDPAGRAAYRDLLRRAVAPGGAVVVATFAEDGPESCSGLPVARYDPAGLLAELGPGLVEVGHGRVDHTTPAGSVQPFTWVAARRLRQDPADG